MVKRGARRGQMKMSFGMIFSIILIVIFLAFAFYAIKTFLGVQNSAQSGKFINDFQSDIDRVWKSAQSSQQETYNLPSKIEYVCFENFNSSARGQSASRYNDLEVAAESMTDNMVFWPSGSANVGSAKMNNLNIAAITSSENPYCIRTAQGKITLTLEKGFSESLVTITR